MRLPRPYIPLSTRIEVAERQYFERFGRPVVRTFRQGRKHLFVVLASIFQDPDRGGISLAPELHHRPALVNRPRKRNGTYQPDANDPRFLVYLPKQEHDIETRVRGLHGQHSDLALVRKRKRKERKAKRPKTRWASRPLKSASRWPKKRTMR